MGEGISVGQASVFVKFRLYGPELGQLVVELKSKLLIVVDNRGGCDCHHTTIFFSSSYDIAVRVFKLLDASYRILP